MGRAVGGVLGEEGGVKLSRGGSKSFGEGRREELFIVEDERVDFRLSEGVQVAATVEGIHVGHHGGRSMNGGPVVG